ncbi:MAG: MoaD/ThiS family protein [Anaerolineales bacterium]
MSEVDVTFQLHTVLQIQTPNGRLTSLPYKMRLGGTIADALRDLGLQINPDETLIVVNRQNVGLDYQPKAGDVIHLIPAIAGG